MSETTFTLEIIGDLRTATVDNVEGVACQATCRVIGQRDGLTFELPISCTFGPLDTQDFTPYAELTQEQVIGWLEALGEVSSAKVQISSVLERMAKEAALTPTPVPWAVAQTPAPSGGA